MEFILLFAFLVLSVFCGMRVSSKNWLGRGVKVVMTAISILASLALGIGIFLWNPINNNTSTIFWSGECLITNATILLAVIGSIWIAIKWIWSYSPKNQSKDKNTQTSSQRQ